VAPTDTPSVELKPGILPAAATMELKRRTTVVFPFEPVTRAMGTSWTAAQFTAAGSGSVSAGQVIPPVPEPTEI